MAGGPCTRLQSHLSVFLETTSVAVDEFQPLVLAFAAVLYVQMAYCGALPCPDTSDTLPTDDLIGINSNDLMLPDSVPLHISRHHLAFIADEGRVGVVDRGSTLSSWVDGQQLGGPSGLSGPVSLSGPEGLLVLGSWDSPFRYRVTLRDKVS